MKRKRIYDKLTETSIFSFCSSSGKNSKNTFACLKLLLICANDSSAQRMIRLLTYSLVIFAAFTAVNNAFVSRISRKGRIQCGPVSSSIKKQVSRRALDLQLEALARSSSFLTINPEVIGDAIFVAPDYLTSIVSKRTDTRVSVSDVSAAGGVSLTTARQDLMKLASMTGAEMQVTKDGDILFIFPSNFMAILLQRLV